MRFDTLVAGATVLTCDAGSRVVEDATIGISEGRLAYVGPRIEAEADQVLNLSGRVITPGFVNVHTHAILTMVRGVAEDLGFAPAYTPGIPHGHDVTPDEAWALSRLGAVEALMFGSTLVNDTYVHADVTMEAMASLGLRVYGCGRIHDADFSLIGDGRWEHHEAIGRKTLDEALALAAKWQGRENGRCGVQLAAHAPDTCSDALLVEIRKAADSAGLRVNTHLAQSKTEVKQVLARSGKTPAQLLEDVGLLNDRLIAAHCIHMDDADLARCGRARIHVAHVPKGNATGGTIAPTVRLRAEGAQITLGTDNMHADMVEVMRWALAMARVQEGRVSDQWQPAHALRMATTGGARAMGLEAELGTLETGKKADLVAFDFRRPHLMPAVNAAGTLVHAAQGRDVELVMVDGEVVIENGLPTRVDLDGILREAQHAADALWKRAGSA